MTTPPRETEVNDLGELITLLPPPGNPRLPEGRLKDLKGHVMSEIQHATVVPPQVRGRRRLLIAASAATSVLAAALAAGLVVHPWDRAGQPAPIIQVLQGDASGATAFLNRVALAAAAKPQQPVGAGQYIYIKSRVAYSILSDDSRRLDDLHDREIWIPQSPGGRGALREAGRPSDLGITVSNEEMVDLPSDPDLLLEKIYADTRGQGNSPDGEAFTAIGDLLRESLMPPKISAALYRAAAKIPGVVLVPDSVDAAGRHGVAVAHVEFGERTEWIFDKTTYEYLGERSYLVEDTSDGKAGMLTATTAVITRAVVDRAGQRP
ncbi:CU044_5270 family protein [Micromonospora sp. NPDC007271]|uniref:CU044_5270 family protein n=1 Tax=Micromonospora sp. NPDC007271 TaxID=3154587 RepID=UPI0033D28B42